MARIFAVTGGNKGIGKSIVKLLLQDKSNKMVYLTARNEELGKNAIKELNDSFGLKAKFHQLDITNLSSINRMRNYLLKNYGGLDVLVNNAGFAYKGSSTAPFSEQAEVTSNINFFGTLNVCDILFPILKPNSKVVNVSSFISEYAYHKLSLEVKSRLSDPNLSMEGNNCICHFCHLYS